MPTIRVHAKGPGGLRKALADVLRRQIDADVAALREVVTLEVAHEVEAAAVRIAGEKGAVVDGLYVNSFRVTSTPNGAEVRNDAPYAAVLEYGRRPGAPGPPLAPIIEWVRKKGIVAGTLTKRGKARKRLTQRQIDDVLDTAKRIRWAIHINGTEPRFIMRDAGLIVPRALRRSIRMHLPARPR